METPRRESVPPFGGWSIEDPSSPVIDYSQVFTRVRADRLGTMPQDNYVDDYNYQPDDTPGYSPDTSAMTRQSSRKNFFQYFVCGARTQAVA